ncbi:uncharacterized protein LAJ45_04175 [Morchella importuna]|uniref:uncharacterized protein n=1 Tax=Morchella importuna TaxID=1174673 RepID=UPI001E8EBD66|nr:uncharacterized protein LAJ45_04175 [Morchella importuna]KAH8151554.1 hypothetical protein LAJ45_04175 [Morchella importuna]
MEELFAMMRRVCGGGSGRAGVSVRLLAYLVREAETLEEGERLLTTWSAERFRRLLKTTPPTTAPRSDDRHLLTSYLTLLLRTPTPPRLSLSLRLLQTHTPRHAPAWNAVLSALCTTPPTTTIAAARLALVWRLYTSMTARHIQADSNTLRLLCVAAERCPGGVDWGGGEPVDVAAGVVERAFGIGMEGGGGGGVPLVAAEAATLHAYVRMLGFAGRRERLEVLVGWLRGGGRVDDAGGREGGEWPGGWPGEEEVERYVVRGWRGGVERGEGEVEAAEVVESGGGEGVEGVVGGMEDGGAGVVVQ